MINFNQMLDHLPLTTSDIIANELSNNIKIVEIKKFKLELDSLTKQLDELSSSKDIFIKQTTEIINNFSKKSLSFFNNTSNTSIYEGESTLSLADMIKQKENFDLKIANIIEQIDYIVSVLDKITTDETFTIIRKTIINKINQKPFINECLCTICYELNIMVDLKFLCRTIDPRRGRPTCESMICLRCARTILGLDKSYEEFHEVKCPTCRKIYIRPRNATNAYTINMPIMRAIYVELITENNSFKKHFGIELNPINCSKCNMSLKSLNDLHHHMRGDNESIPCSMSKVKCAGPCGIFVCRKYLINDMCSICTNHVQDL